MASRSLGKIYGSEDDGIDEVAAGNYWRSIEWRSRT